MLNSKLFELIRHFDKKEWKRFGEFLASPYFIKDDALWQFYSGLNKYAPAFESPQLERSKFIKTVPWTKPMDEKKLTYLMSAMLDAGERFIKLEQLEQQELQGYCALLGVYNRWEVDKLFNQTLKKAQQYLEGSDYRNTEFYYSEFLLQNQLNAYFDKQKKRSSDRSLQEAANYLDLFYISTKLKYSCELINRQKVVSGQYELRMLKEVRQHVEDFDYSAFPSIMIYYRILMTFMENDQPDHFTALKHLLEKAAGQFPPEEARDMYAYAQNYCIRKANAGNNHFLSELFNLYRSSIELDLVIIDGYISPWTYKNIVSVATRVGEIPWAENFIKEYRQLLHVKFRNNAYNYNMAYLQFAKGAFDEALVVLNKVAFTDVFYALDSRVLQLKIYYELDEIDPLNSAQEAFKVFLRRNKTISENIKTIYMNFVRFLNRMLAIPPGDKEKKEKLRQKISATGQVADIKWLLAKLDT